MEYHNKYGQWYGGAGTPTHWLWDYKMVQEPWYALGEFHKMLNMHT